MKNKILLLAIALLSNSAFAGDWYDDWDEITDTRYVWEVNYYGNASCYSSDSSYFSSYVHSSNSSTVCLHSSGNAFPGYCGTTTYQCSASLPYSESIKVPITSTRYKEIQPYASNVTTETSTCTAAGYRKFLITAHTDESISNLKVYVGASYEYPETLVYSGVHRSALLLTAFPVTKDLNVRVKLDGGSSYYSIIRDVKCGRGGGIPR